MQVALLVVAFRRHREDRGGRGSGGTKVVSQKKGYSGLDHGRHRVRHVVALCDGVQGEVELEAFVDVLWVRLQRVCLKRERARLVVAVRDV